MRTIAVVEWDPKSGPLGRPSRADLPLPGGAAGGGPVIAGVVRRLKALPVEAVVVLVPPDARAQAEALVAGTGAEVLSCDAPDVPDRARWRRARRWAIESWRGGLLETFVHDEQGNPGALCAAAAVHQAGAVLLADAGGPLVDLGIARRQIEALSARPLTVLFETGAGPPGLIPTLYRTEYLALLAHEKKTPRETLQVEEGAISPDPVQSDFFLPAEEPVQACAARFTADTARGAERLGRLLRDHPGLADAGASAVVAASAAAPELTWGRLPRFVVVELFGGGRPGAAGSLCTPDAGRARRTLDPGFFGSLLDEICTSDDTGLTLGGFGEPTLHPQFGALLARLASRRPFGVHLECDGAGLDARTIESILAADLDVVTVTLDAARPETHAAVRGGCTLAEAEAGVERFLESRARSGKTFPLVCPVFTKCLENDAEQEEFWDRWTKTTDGVILRGFNDRAGQRADRSVLHLGPARRRLCEALLRQMTVLADGTVAQCMQDFRGTGPLGRFPAQSLSAAWSGAAAAALRDSHRAGRFDSNPLCGACRDWGHL